MALAASITLQLGSSVLFMIGVQTRAMAMMMLLFLLPITFMVHDLWTITEDVYLQGFTVSKNGIRSDRIESTEGAATAATAATAGVAGAAGAAGDGADGAGGKGKEKEAGGHAQATFSVSRRVPTFATLFDNEFVHFFKNIGMIGGLVLFLEAGVV